MVEIAPHSKIALIARAKILGVREGSVEHRVLSRMLKQERPLRSAAQAQVLAEMREAEAEELLRANRRAKIGKAKLARKAHPKFNALRRKHTAGLVERLEAEIAASKKHRARMQMISVQAKADDRRYAATIASYRSMKRSRG